MNKGKFIVIEGIDGSGKSTQVNFLMKYLKENNIQSYFIHFPVIDDCYGLLISKFLRGEFGSINNVNPYLVAAIFAENRKNFDKTLREVIESGLYIVCDRYVYSNIAYQCAKLKKNEESDELKQWIIDIEYGRNNLLVPDISIFLDVPFEFVKANLLNRANDNVREYLSGKDDIHEIDVDFQYSVYLEYRRIMCNDTKLINLNCYDKNNEILPSLQIHEDIISVLNRFNIL